MSTHTSTAPSAPELPSSSHGEATTAAAEGTVSSDWTYYGNTNEAAEKPTLNASDAADVSKDSSAGTSNAPKATSSTAYSFPGSALGSDSTANLNDTSAKTESSTETKTNTDEDKNDDSIYECNICLDTAKDAVVSLCGHLFCWPCLHQWLETRPNCKLCPVCKAAIGKDKVIPLYGRNTTKQEDPRNKVPPRPAGQRTEPEPQQGFQGFGFGDGFHMSFGIGAFPFGYFASSFNFGEPRAAAANRGTTQFEDEQQLSKLFLYLAFLCIAWLLFA